MKKVLIAVLILVVLGIGSILFIGRTYYPDNIASTTPDGGPKGLKTREYTAEVERVRTESSKIIGSLSTWGGSWKLVDEAVGDSETRLKAEVPVVGFTDDFEVTIKKSGEGKSVVNVKSSSRVGKSDFGENARHVRQFLSALDSAMKN